MLKQKTFTASFTGFATHGNLKRITDKVAQDMADWINANEARYSVEHVSVSHGWFVAYGVVFYREI